MKELDGEVQRIERQVTNQRRTAAQLGGVSMGAKTATGNKNDTASKTKTPMRDKRDVGQRIVLLENRLDGVMINFNATLSANSLIRKEIDHLVQERSNFNDMIAKYQKKIQANKKTIADITELAIQAFDQRDECQSKIQALQERNTKDAQQYAAELKELQRTLDHDEKLKDFLFHKSNDRVFATQFEEDEKEKGKKEREEKEQEDVQKYKDALERIQRVVGTDSSLDRIVADFVKVEDQNFALFNYVTEMNNQVEALQEVIGRLKSDIKEAKGRGEEKERQQREQMNNMEKKLDTSAHEAESAETKLNLMESVIAKLKVGTEDLYTKAGVGSTPVLSLLGDKDVGKKEVRSEEDGDAGGVAKPFITENNVIMYLDMVNEKIIELKGVTQYMKAKELSNGDLTGIANDPQQLKLLLAQGASSSAASASVLSPSKNPIEKQLKRMPSSAQLLGKMDEDLASTLPSDEEEEEVKPFDMSALKTRAFVLAQRERKEAAAAARAKLAPPVDMVEKTSKKGKGRGRKSS